MSAAARVLTVTPDLSKYVLRCRECHKSWGNQPKSICDDCFSPLEVSYDYDALRGKFTHERIAQPRSRYVALRGVAALARELSAKLASGIYASASCAEAGCAPGCQESFHQK